MTTLRVGIIGVNAERGWARESHVPAIRATEGLELAAVATRRQESADAAARAFDVPTAFGDPLAMIASSDIDVVAVASAVATHHELVTAALHAGKHVLTEWPVAVGTGATTSLADAAATSDRHVAVGLQARRNPAVLRAAELLAQGRIGEVLVARVFSSTAGFGAEVDASSAPLEDPAAGMHLLTIQAAHTLDLVHELAGTPDAVAGLLTTRFPEVRTADGGTIRRTLPDHVLVQGRLGARGAMTVEVEGGRPVGDTPFHLVLEGTEGTLELTGGAARGFQAGVLRLAVDGEPEELAPTGLPDAVVNVAGVYRALRDDVRDGTATATAPSLDDAARLARTIDDLVGDGGAS